MLPVVLDRVIYGEMRESAGVHIMFDAERRQIRPYSNHRQNGLAACPLGSC